MRRNELIDATWPRILFIATLLILAAYFGWAWLNNQISVPKEFLEARAKGAVLAGDIVDLSKESIENLKAISLHNEKKDYLNGLNLVVEEIARNEESRRKAIELSAELEVMALGIEDLRPKKASDIALQAVITESQIAQRLINYNGHINELLNQFRVHFTKTGQIKQEDIKALIDKMNLEISAINELNEKYSDLMKEFDDIVS